MGKIATNTNQQIERLQDRGMNFDIDEQKVKEILLDIGYYRLGFYWNPFERNGKHEFISETKFSTIVSLYYLDVDLRHLLIKYINRIEINFRTKVVYYISNKYKNSPTWFADPSIINADFVNELEKYYTDDFKKKNKTIQQHHRKNINDRYAPAWKTLEYFSFGTILKIFKSIKDITIKERIANEYGILNLKKFINLMDTVVYIRNTCAHGGVLFDLNTPRGIAKLPDLNFHNDNRHSLDSAIKAIAYILNKISSNRNKELNKGISSLFLSYKSEPVLKQIIENKIGFLF